MLATSITYLNRLMAHDPGQPGPILPLVAAPGASAEPSTAYAIRRFDTKAAKIVKVNNVCSRCARRRGTD